MIVRCAKCEMGIDTDREDMKEVENGFMCEVCEMEEEREGGVKSVIKSFSFYQMEEYEEGLYRYDMKVNIGEKVIDLDVYEDVNEGTFSIGHAFIMEDGEYTEEICFYNDKDYTIYTKELLDLIEKLLIIAKALEGNDEDE